MTDKKKHIAKDNKLNEAKKNITTTQVMEGYQPTRTPKDISNPMKVLGGYQPTGRIKPTSKPKPPKSS